jgi:hypothetical protein
MSLIKEGFDNCTGGPHGKFTQSRPEEVGNAKSDLTGGVRVKVSTQEQS